MSLDQLPDNLPKPKNDGAADHLVGMKIPSFEIPSTHGIFSSDVLKRGAHIVFCYPMTGTPGKPLPENWEQIPGARGCTLENIGFTKNYEAFQNLGFEVYGISTQSIDAQKEMSERLRVPYEVLSDEAHLCIEALTLPTIQVEGITMIKRLTMIIRDGTIEHVFYPVFPPDAHPDVVLGWVQEATNV